MSLLQPAIPSSERSPLDHRSTPKRLVVLGSTGSIGVNTLDVVAHHPERFQVASLTAGGNDTLLIEQALRFRPDIVAIEQAHKAPRIKEALAGTAIRVVSGQSGVMEAATWETATMVVSAIVGAAGLAPTLKAIQAGKDIALANKECLVMAGTVFMREVARYGVRLIPVDSEHSAIFQALFNGRPETTQGGHPAQSTPSISHRKEIQALTLTASGGPFRGWSREQLRDVTPDMALAHPRWKMGRKISIDSATMMNKGLEVIEAFHLFGMAADQIQVIVHPESIVHSMVSYRDGSVLAQLGMPDMRTPIAVALAWPERIPTTVPALDLAKVGPLHFFDAPEPVDFPCLALAHQALRQGGGMATVLNAANEVAVASFLDKKIGFLDISRLIEWTMAQISVTLPGSASGSMDITSIEDILQTDREARHQAGVWVARHGRESH